VLASTASTSWQNPQKESPKWSEDDGLIVKRKGNPRESTREAWGLGKWARAGDAEITVE